jgi:hypothetical protein
MEVVATIQREAMPGNELTSILEVQHRLSNQLLKKTISLMHAKAMDKVAGVDIVIL